MKGKMGESPLKGVKVDNPPPGSSRGARVMAAAKKRKRGGAVKADIKVEGDMPKARCDRPKRASGGMILSEAERAAEDAMKKPDGPRKFKTGDLLKSKALKARPLNASPKSDDDTPKRMRGGKVGANTAPFSTARSEKPAKGHSTQVNA